MKSFALPILFGFCLCGVSYAGSDPQDEYQYISGTWELAGPQTCSSGKAIEFDAFNSEQIKDYQIVISTAPATEISLSAQITSPDEGLKNCAVKANYSFDLTGNFSNPTGNLPAFDNVQLLSYDSICTNQSNHGFSFNGMNYIFVEDKMKTFEKIHGGPCPHGDVVISIYKKK